jgi:hypothetical protein
MFIVLFALGKKKENHRNEEKGSVKKGRKSRNILKCEI